MNGDDDLKWLIAREIPHLRRYAVVLVGQPHQADDLVQDCLERALRKRHLWRRRGRLRSWLFRLLYRRYVDRGRQASRLREITDEAASELPTSQPARQEHAAQVRDIATALRRLPEEQRMAIVLVGVEGLSYEEAAQVLDVPIGTLRSRLWRGREALREVWLPRTAETALRRVK
jgi:RNA polymerase sigma-70 factor (ECF subfamily)